MTSPAPLRIAAPALALCPRGMKAAVTGSVAAGAERGGPAMDIATFATTGYRAVRPTGATGAAQIGGPSA